MADAWKLIACACAATCAATASPLDALSRLEPRTFGVSLRRAAQGKVMVLLAGWPDDHRVWRHLVRTFESEYHIISFATPDLDREGLRHEPGYDFLTVPNMIAGSLEAHLGSTRDDVVLIAHDWGAIWAYYIVQQPMWARRVTRLVAVDVGASASNVSDTYADIPGISHTTLWSIPYQWLCASLFAIGRSISPTLATFLGDAAWPLVPFLGPMGGDFDWAQHAPRPREEVRWWMGYPYYYVWKHHRVWWQSPISPAFPTGIPTLFMYGAKKRTMFHSEAFEGRLNATDGSRVLRYEECGHWLMHEAPARFTDDVMKFLDDTEGAASRGGDTSSTSFKKGSERGGSFMWTLVPLSILYAALAAGIMKMV